MADQQPYHRKIELQSPDDLQFLISNIRRAADAEIEMSLPSLPGVTDGLRGEDDMRVVVERLVGEYIKEVLLTTAANITINGLPASEELLREVMHGDPNARGKTREEFEAFDHKTGKKLTEMMGEEEALIEEVARLRRAVPGVVVGREREAWRRVEGEDEGTLSAAAAAAAVKGEEGDGEAGLVLDGGVGGNVGMVRNWEKGVKGLERMVKGEATEIGARKERAERAEGYVSAMKK